MLEFFSVIGGLLMHDTFGSTNKEIDCSGSFLNWAEDSREPYSGAKLWLFASLLQFLWTPPLSLSLPVHLLILQFPPSVWQLEHDIPHWIPFELGKFHLSCKVTVFPELGVSSVSSRDRHQLHSRCHLPQAPFVVCVPAGEMIPSICSVLPYYYS